jgi:hypothetical protein
MSVDWTLAMAQYEHGPRVGSAEADGLNRLAPGGALKGCDNPLLADLLGRSKRGAL